MGRCKLKLTIEVNTPKDHREIVVWRPPNDDELMSLKVGQQPRRNFHKKNHGFGLNLISYYNIILIPT